MKLKKQGIILASVFALAAGIAGDGQAACSSLDAAYRQRADYMIDAKTGETLLAFHEDTEFFPASITKVMTVYLGLKAMRDGKVKPTERFKVPEPNFTSSRKQTNGRDAIPFGTDEVSFQTALDATMIESSNSGPRIAADGTSGNEEAFVAAMNAEKNGKYKNVHGFPFADAEKYQRMTARGVVSLYRKATSEFPAYFMSVAVPTKKLIGYRNGKEFSFTVKTHNDLLPGSPSSQALPVKNVMDGKTGYACQAGWNWVGRATINGRVVIAASVGHDTRGGRNHYLKEMFEHPSQEILTNLKKAEEIELARNAVQKKETDYAKLEILVQWRAAEITRKHNPILLKEFPPLRDRQPGDLGDGIKMPWIRERDSEMQHPFTLTP